MICDQDHWAVGRDNRSVRTCGDICRDFYFRISSGQNVCCDLEKTTIQERMITWHLTESTTILVVLN